MSGSTIGGVVGGIIGFYVGGPSGAQMGWMIGAGIGSIVDPQQIQGRQWNNQTMQGSQDGLARAVVFGTGTVVGNLLDSEPKPRKGTRKESAGKGGPEIKHDTAKLTYAIEICDSSELRGTKVNGVIAVWEDERLVYDVRPGTQLSAADSAKWLKNKRFFYGEETQVPPPELEAIHGVGNVPAYRGTCGMVVWDEDLMVDIKDNPRGRMPTYRFLVSVCGVTPGGIDGLGPRFLAIDGGAIVRPIGTSGFLGTDDTIIYGGGTINVKGGARFGDDVIIVAQERSRKASVTDLSTWTDGPAVSLGFYGGSSVKLSGGRLWVAAGAAGVGYIESPSDAAFTFISEFGGTTIVDIAATDDYVIAVGMYGGVWRRDTGGSFLQTTVLFTVDYPPDLFFITAVDEGDGRIVVAGYNSEGILRAKYSDDRGDTFLPCTVPAMRSSAPHIRCCGDFWLIPCMSGGVGTSLGGMLWSSDGATFVDVPDLAGIIFGQTCVDIDREKGRVIAVGTDMTADQVRWFESYDGMLWTEFDGTDTNTSMVITLYPDELSGTAIPDIPGYYVDGDGNVVGPSIGEGQMCGMPLDTLVKKLHGLGAPQLVDADLDFTALAADTVRGYVVQDASLTVADACDPLRRVFTFDLPSYDLKIRAVKRGGAIAWTVDPDDLVAGENASDSSTRGQGVEYPKKLHVGYVDPVLDYKLTTQISERYSTSINVVGEDRLDTLLTLSADEGAQAAQKLHKILWTELEDTRGFTLPLEYLKAAPADLFSYHGRRYRVEQMRIEGMRIVFENAAYDRASAYVSNATGVQGQAPPSPGSRLRGPTVSALMNLPVLRDADDRAGIYWAASGLLPTWQGAVLEVQRNGVWTEVARTTQAATVGTLREALPVAPRHMIDGENTLQLRMYDEIDALAFADLLREGNPLAIKYDDGTAEIVQVQTPVEVSPGIYDGTTLIRGRLDTTIAHHAKGARVALLDSSLAFVPLEMADLGQTLTFRAVSIGTDPDAAPTQQITLTTIESVREWQPDWVRWERDAGNALVVRWLGRARLGTDADPAHSQHFGGYLVTIKSGSTTKSWTTRDEWFALSAAEQSGIFGSSTFTPSLVQVEAISASGDAAGGSYTFPSGLSGWIAAQSGWSVSGGIVKYDPTVSGQATGFIRLNAPVPFVSGQVFRAKVHAYSDAMNVVGAAGSAYYRAGGYTDMSEAGTVHTYMSTLTSYPKPNADQISPALYAMTDGVAPVHFENLSFSVT